MARGDPYPNREMLSPVHVRRIFDLSSRKDFEDFVAEHPMFPKPIPVGKTANGKPRMKYKKSQILAFIDLLGG